MSLGVLRGIASAAGGQDIFNPVRSSTDQGRLVILGSVRLAENDSAVSAPVSVTPEEGTPFQQGVATLRSFFAGASRGTHLGGFFGMPFVPVPNRRTGLLGIGSRPFQMVGRGFRSIFLPPIACVLSRRLDVRMPGAVSRLFHLLGIVRSVLSDRVASLLGIGRVPFALQSEDVCAVGVAPSVAALEIARLAALSGSDAKLDFWLREAAA